MGDPAITCRTCGFTYSAEESACLACGTPRPGGETVAAAPGGVAAGAPGTPAWAPSAPSTPAAVEPPGSDGLFRDGGGSVEVVRPSAVGRTSAPRPPSRPRSEFVEPVTAAAAGGVEPAASYGAPAPSSFTGAAENAGGGYPPPASRPDSSWRPPSGASSAEMARRFAQAGKRRRKAPPIARMVVGLVVLFVVVSQMWSCLQVGCEVDDQTYQVWDPPAVPVDEVVPDTPDPAAGSPEAVLLRKLLDGLMAVNAGLPATVEEPRPDDAAAARRWAKRLRSWRVDYGAGSPDARLAGAGERFGDALARWLEQPDDARAYDAYDWTWHAWDRLDDTWESAEE